MGELIEQIRNHETLAHFCADSCGEGTAEVRISDRITESCIVNPEKYFESLRLGNTPASVDYIITTICRSRNHNHNLVELKSISTTLRNEDAQIYKKFENTIDKFIFGSFEDVYCSEGILKLKLYLIHNIKKNSELQLLKKLFLKPIKRKNRNFYIRSEKSPYELKSC
jgi:hypothetical protein